MKIKLVEFDHALLEDDHALQTLADWRNSALHTFQNHSPATIETTKNWLRSVVFSDPHKKLYFIQEDRYFVRPFVGHIGVIYNGLEPTELGYVMRGRSESPGAMSEAIKTLIEMHRHLTLRVLPSNKHAIEFYKKLGFCETGSSGGFVTMSVFRSESLPRLVDLESELAKGEWIWK